MESTSAEQLPNDEKIEQKEEIQNDEVTETPTPQRRDFNSDNNKIELGNLGKFAFGVSISMRFVFEGVRIQSCISFLQLKLLFFSKLGIARVNQKVQIKTNKNKDRKSLWWP